MLILERERPQLLFHLLMHSLVDSYTWPDQMEPIAWLYWDGALTNWATGPVPLYLKYVQNIIYQLCFIIAFKSVLVFLRKRHLKPVLYTHTYTYFLILKNILFINFQRERKGRRKRGRETSVCGCLLCAPNLGPGLQPRRVPWLGIEPASLWIAVQLWIHWDTSAWATYIFLSFLLRCLFILQQK